MKFSLPANKSISTWLIRLWSLRSWLLYPLPHHLLSRVMFFLSRLHTPLATPAIKCFVKKYHVDLSEALHHKASDYPSFNSFFTRALQTDARPLATGKDLVFPCDGHISQAADINSGILVQAKGLDYTVSELLGNDTLANVFQHGSFITCYLAPGNYHRVHMPCDGTLEKMVHVPGRLFSMSPNATRTLPRIFTRNERVACLFDSEHEKIALVMVGAMNVGAMETVWAGMVTPSGWGMTQNIYHDRLIKLKRGEEMGRFNMGSTVILLTEKRILGLSQSLPKGRAVTMGEAMISESGK